jgi:hypothetical protein
MTLEEYVRQLLGTDEELLMEVEPSFVLCLPDEEDRDD